MKQYILMFLVASLILIILPSQTNAPIQPKQYTVTLPIEAWQSVMDVIDKSNAGHLQVKQVQDLILPQLQKQIADTTKPKK